MTTASPGRGCSGYGSSSGGWRNRRPLCSASTTKPTAGPGGDGDGEEDHAAAAAAAAAAGRGGGEAEGVGLELEEKKEANNSSNVEVDGEQQQEEGSQPKTRKRRPAATRRRSVPHSFGKPLSMLDDGGGDYAPSAGSGAAAVGRSGVDAEDELPDPQLIEVEKEGDQQAAADANDPRRVTAVRARRGGGR